MVVDAQGVRKKQLTKVFLFHDNVAKTCFVIEYLIIHVFANIAVLRKQRIVK